jgi:hypothetical protein
MEIVIAVVVDVIEALANDSLLGSIYLLDNNKANGSSNEGTESLKTKVNEGDQLFWVTHPLECEVFASISGIEIDREYCDPEERSYPGTEVTFWAGKVKKSFTGAVPYVLRFRLGSREEEMSTSDTPAARPSLVGRNA